jgi:hypothetical protein
VASSFAIHIVSSQRCHAPDEDRADFLAVPQGRRVCVQNAVQGFRTARRASMADFHRCSNQIGFLGASHASTADAGAAPSIAFAAATGLPGLLS